MPQSSTSVSRFKNQHILCAAPCFYYVLCERTVSSLRVCPFFLFQMSPALNNVIFSVLAICTINLLVINSSSTSAVPICMGKVCRCKNDSVNHLQVNQTAVRCNIKNIQDLKNYIKQPERVHTL